MTRNRLLLIAGALTVLALTCCGFAQNAGSKGTTIGVSLPTRQDQFYGDLEKGLQDEAAKQGFALQIVSCEKDDHLQATQVDDFIAKKVGAIVLCPTNPNTIKESVLKAQQAKIVVVTAGIAANNARVDCHVGSDNIQGGRLAALALMKGLPAGGDIVILNDTTVGSAQDRAKGFRQEIEANPKYKIVEDQPAEGKRDKAMQVMQDILKNTQKIDGVLGINDETALGALDAISKAGRKGIVIVGFDATPEAREQIDAGALYADSVQFPAEIGKMAIQAIAKVLKREDVPNIIPVKTGLYMKGGKIVEANEFAMPFPRMGDKQTTR